MTIKPNIVNKPLVALCLSTALSAAGTFFFLIVLSTQIYQKMHSSFFAGMVFAAQWILPLFLAGSIAKLFSKFKIRSLMIFAEVSSVVFTLAIGITFSGHFTFSLAGLLLIRGLLEAINKTGRMTALKNFLPQESLNQSSSLLSTSYYVGIALGSMLSTFLGSNLSLLQISIFDASTFATSALMLTLLPSKPVPLKQFPNKSHSFSEAWATLIKNRSIQYFLFLILSVTFFQGFHNVARTVYPIEFLNLGPPGVGYLQTTNIAAIIMGSVLMPIFAKKWPTAFQNPKIFFLLSTLLMFSLTLTNDPWTGLLFYFGFAFFFEFSFLISQNRLIIINKTEQIPLIFSWVQPLSSSGMTFTIVSSGLCVDKFGFQSATSIVTLLATLCAVVLILQKTRTKL